MPVSYLDWSECSSSPFLKGFNGDKYSVVMTGQQMTLLQWQVKSKTKHSKHNYNSK